MEKKICSLLTSIAIVSFCLTNAQPHIGLKAGLVTSNVDADYSNTYSSYNNKAKISALIGILFDLPLNKDLLLRPGIELVFKGSKESQQGSYFDGTTYDFTINRQLTYLDIPLNLMFAFKNDKRKILIGGGPVAGFLLNKSGYMNHAIKDLDLGVNVSVCYEWPIGFFINLNHDRSLQNISANKDYFTDFKNQSFGLSLGYIF